jgi:hypothetical protein
MQNQSFQKHHVVPVTALLGVNQYPTALAVGQIGIFDSVSNTSVVSPMNPTNREIYIGYRLPMQADAPMARSVANPYYTHGIKASHITGWRGYRGHKGRTEIVAIGYDGLDAAKNLNCIEGGTKSLYVLIDGSPITKLHGAQGKMLRYDVDGPCDADGIPVECTAAQKRIQMNELVAKINADTASHWGFIEASPLENSSFNYDTVNSTGYNLVIADAGTDIDLAIVQSMYPANVVSRTSRDGVMSTYFLYATSQPAAFSTGNIVAIPNCTTCPTGYTSRASHTYTFSKVDAGDATALTAIQGMFNINQNEVLGEIVIRTGYAMGISTYLVVSDYPFTAAGATVNEVQSLSANGASAGTFTLTFDGETTGTIAYNANTATIQAALNALSNIASGDVVVAVAGASTANLAATTFTFSGTAYIGQNVPQISVDITALTGATGGVMSTSTAGTLDTTTLQGFTYLGLLSTTCILETPTSVAWVANGTGKQFKRSAFLTLADTECGTDRLAELQAAYSGTGTVSIESTATCLTKYKIVTLSNIVGSACYPDEAVFPILNSYQGSEWVDQGLISLSGSEGTLFGVVIKAAAFNRYTSECTYGDFTDDFDGIHIRVSEYDNNYNGTPSKCLTSWPITKLQSFAPPSNLGAQVRQLEEGTYLDVLRGYSYDAGVRQADGFKFLSEADKIYDTYTIEYVKSYPVGGFSTQYQDTYHEHFHFVAGQGKAFETAMNAFVMSSTNLPPVVL